MQDQILAAKNAYLSGRSVPPGLIRPEIMASWKRSVGFGVQVGNVDKSVLSPRELQNRIRSRQTLYDIAVPFLESLNSFTTGSGYLTVISDEEGYVLKLLGDQDIRDQAEKNVLVEGCNRSERRLGTNAIGTCIETGQPIQIQGHEHYYSMHSHWVCSGAPIFNADGNTAGAFCIIGPDDKVSFHTLGMAAAAAEAITRQLRMQRAYDIIDIAHNNMTAMIEHIPNSLLLLDKGLKVMMANSKAAAFFHKKKGDLEGKSFFELFGRDTMTADIIRAGVADRNITFKRNGRQINLSLSVLETEGGEYLVTFEQADTLHKKLNRIIGSNANFVFDDIVGDSPVINTTIYMAKIAAENNSSVLLMGESGTGKELFAQAIHNASDRRDEPFIALNCGALPKSLIESELFGYEGGSFTGAKQEGRAGKFELANGGTIFLDEIGDMPFDVQVNLLRVLQNREIVRIGADKTTKIDVRVIAATNQDLQEAIANNSFRSDLFYRLNVFSITLPPLRERIGDVRRLADYFLKKYADNSNVQVRGLTPDAYGILEHYNWPGNIRELENIIERAVYITRDGWIDATMLPTTLSEPQNTVKVPSLREIASPREDVSFSIKKNERKQIESALAQTGGNVKKAADILEISRRTLYRKMEKYGVR